LYIGGAGLSHGYLNNAELTLQRFVPNPFADSAATRLYKTGDQVAWLPSGQLEYLGRIDDQVKLRGFRIDPGEIETVITQFPGVGQALAVVSEHQPGDQRLLSYVVGSTPTSVDLPQLRLYLKRMLPAYMVPALISIDRLPQTANGKIDRRALPPLSSSVQDTFVEPRTEIERTIGRIWAELLQVGPVSVTTSFFDLGGHSLLGVTLMYKLEQIFGRTLPLSALFDNPTIESLARYVQEHHAPGSSLKPLNANGFKPPFFIAGGHPLYQEIARCLGPDQPVYKMDLYALVEARLLAGERAYEDLPSMVAEFVKDIRALQPNGPYYLGGACHGGIVALEAARQLQAQGQKVALLLEWETRAPSFYRRGTVHLLTYVIRLALSRLKSGIFLHATKQKLRDLLTTKQLWFGHHMFTLGTHQFGLDPRQRHSYVWDVMWQAIGSYRSNIRYEGRIVYICAAEQVTSFPDVTTGWEDICTGGLDVHRLPGDHTAHMYTFLPQCVDAIRSALSTV
jgi:thioesterase domain-containing protein/acyl carrier protein